MRLRSVAAEMSVRCKTDDMQVLRPFLLTYTLGNMFLKASLAFYFNRFDLGKWPTRIMIIAVVLYWLYVLPWSITFVTECGVYTDVRKSIPNYILGKCTPWSILGPMHYVGTVYNCVTDLIFIMIPVWVISRSHMSQRQKRLSIALVGIGLLGTLCSAIRLGYIQELRITNNIFPSGGIIETSLIELALGIVASCLGTLLPLVVQVKHAMSSKKETVDTPSGPGGDNPAPPYAEPIHGVGMLSNFMSKTKLSTVTSAIHRRIREEDFKLYGAEGGQFATLHVTSFVDRPSPVVTPLEHPYSIDERLSTRDFEQRGDRV